MNFLLAILPALAADVTLSVSRMPLPAGKAITWDDLSTVSLPEALVPPGTVRLGTELVGQRLAFPVAGGAPIVAARLVGGPAPASADGATTTVEIEVGALGSVLRPGDRLLAARGGRVPCLDVTAEVHEPGPPTLVGVATDDAARLSEPGLIWLLAASEAVEPPLPACAPAEAEP